MYGLTSEPQFLQTTLRSTSATPQKIARRRGRARPAFAIGSALAAPRCRRRRRRRGARSRAPWRCSRLAATALRWPDEQITATGRAGVDPVGHAVDVVVGHVDRAGDVALVPLGALAHVEHLERRVVASRVGRSRRTSMRSIAPTSRVLRPPARHAAGEVAAELADPDRGGELRRARARRRRRGRSSTISWSRSAIQASLVPKPACSIGMQTAPGMCASSNWRSVRTSTSSAPSRALLLDLARRERQHLDARGHQRPAVDRDDRLEVRRLRRQRSRSRARRSASSSLSPKQLVVAPLVADRRGDLHVHARARRTASRRGGPGQTSVSARQRQQLVVQRVEDAARALLLVDREVGPGDVADEQRVAGQHRPRLVAAARCRSARTPCARAGGPGVCSARTRTRAELELPAVVERLVVVVGLGVAVDVDRRAGRGGQPAVAGDVVGVVVRLEDVLDRARPCSARARGSRRSRSAGRPPRRRRRPRRRQVGGAAEVVVGDLAEDHRAA